jgi:MoaA/NifB/PqqE/SkfB family radical SAM enzyme
MNDNARQFGAEKLLQHLDRLAAWQQGELAAPVTVELDLTNACNHACPGCTFSYLVNIDKSSLPFDLARRVIGELGAMGVRAITFSGGGEPLVYGVERFLELAGEVRAAGMDAALITNGSLLTPDPRYAMFEWVRVSLDAYDDDTFLRFHGRGPKEFAKVVERLRAFCAEGKRRRAARERWPTVGVGFLTDRDSLDRGDFFRMAEFCSRIPGLDYVQFRPLVVNMVDDPTLQGGGAAISRDVLQCLAIQAAMADGLYARPDFKVLWSEGTYRALGQASFGRTYDRCLGHFLEATISADAKVYLCCHTQGQERFALGDLNEETFGDIWHGERARRVYESFDPRATCPPACRLHLQNQMLHEISLGATHTNFI